MSAARRFVWTAASAALLACGCRPAAEAPVADAVTTTAERGPIRIAVEVSPARPRVGDTVTIAMSAEAPAEYGLRFPTPADFDPLAVREVGDVESRPGAQGVVRRRQYAFEPLVGGPLELPALGVHYALEAGAGATQPALENELVAGPLHLEVRSALSSADQPNQPRDITGTLLPPRPPLPLWQKLAWAGGAAGLLVAGYVAYRLVRRALTRPPPPVLPEVWALRELRQLEGTDWYNVAQVRACFYRLTEVVRQYIERKFGLAAPEMTTEEFLTTLARHRSALPYDPQRLREFLEACDIVKYAAVHPRPEDGAQVLVTARAFVAATASTAPPTAPATAGT